MARAVNIAYNLQNMVGHCRAEGLMQTNQGWHKEINKFSKNLVMVFKIIGTKHLGDFNKYFSVKCCHAPILSATGIHCSNCHFLEYNHRFAWIILNVMFAGTYWGHICIFVSTKFYDHCATNILCDIIFLTKTYWK